MKTPHIPAARPLLPLALAALLAMPAAQARVQVEGASFEPAHDLGGVTVDLEGTAVFSYLMFKVYAAALYLPAEADGADVLDADTPRRLEVAYFRDVSAKDLARAADGVLEEALTPAERSALAERIQRLHGWYRDVSAGDRYALSYAPGRGTTLELNGEALGTVPGADFARAYFAIWLGEVPMDEELRAALLAGDDGPRGSAVTPRPAGTGR